MEKKKMTWGRFCTIIFMLEVLLLMAFMTTDGVSRIMAMEGISIENSLGTDALKEIDKRASESFYELVVESGLYADLHKVMVPENKKPATSDIEKKGKGAVNWIEGRLNAWMYLLFQFLERVHLLVLWLPSSSLVFFACLYSGIALRMIKQGNFAFSSPAAHRSGIRSIIFIVAMLPLYFLFPAPITPYLYPCLNIVWGFFLITIISNIAKRI